MDDSVLRENLVELLRGGNAYTTPARAIQGLKPENRNRRPGSDGHSVWEELEHMRIAQEDILRYTLNANWKSPKWPQGYWPPHSVTFSQSMWDDTVSGFFGNLEELIALVEDKNMDLTQRIPHGDWRTYLREILLAADHNAYHLGQLVQTRKLLGDWDPGR
jgi:uncharacterized damage-inducible protein DinB